MHIIQHNKVKLTWSLKPGMRKRAVERRRTMRAVLVWPCLRPPLTTIWWSLLSWAASVLFWLSRALIFSYKYRVTVTALSSTHTLSGTYFQLLVLI